MGSPITVEELYQLEAWAKENLDIAPQFQSVTRALSTLRDLMSQQLTQKNLLKYLHQQMGITPKSERGNNSLSKQSGESAIPRAILRQP